jgi:hypothetical protein
VSAKNARTEAPPQNQRLTQVADHQQKIESEASEPLPKHQPSSTDRTNSTDFLLKVIRPASAAYSPRQGLLKSVMTCSRSVFGRLPIAKSLQLSLTVECRINWQPN